MKTFSAFGLAVSAASLSGSPLAAQAQAATTAALAGAEAGSPAPMIIYFG